MHQALQCEEYGLQCSISRSIYIIYRIVLLKKLIKLYLYQYMYEYIGLTDKPVDHTSNEFSGLKFD